MKKIVLIFLAINLGLLIFLMGMVFLAEVYPFHPGDALFGVQHTAEQARLRLFASSSQQAEYGLALLERRVADLALAGSQDRVIAAAQAVDEALAEAILRNSAAPAAAQGVHYKRLDILVEQADLVLASLSYDEDLPVISSLQTKVTALLECQTTSEYVAVLPEEKTSIPRIEAEIVSFLGKSVEHRDFPLIGGHDQVECLACHPSGKYVDTSTECSACHNLPEKSNYLARFDSDVPYIKPVYPNHFAGECSECHSADNWIPYQFDHVGTVECLSCHENDTPKKFVIQEDYSLVLAAFRFVSNNRIYTASNHYPGECISCHTDTADWAEAAYDHSQSGECIACHQPDTPISHYAGTCESCHEDVEDWNIASMDHAELTDCISCHTSDAPQEHYTGQCASCHETADWSRIVVNHSGLNDCRTCHQKPAGHYPGQCSNCHSVNNWETISFTHKGASNCENCHSIPSNHFSGACSTCHIAKSWATTIFTHLDVSDCSTCHTKDTPPDHYRLECANCHEVTTWLGVVYNHTETTGCSTCHPTPENHYMGECQNCHNTTTWHEYYFDHTGLTDCVACHAIPPGHYPGQCSNCHVPVKWIMIDFDHTGYTLCSSCHTPEEGHWPGECSSCHTIENWYEISFDHTNYTNCKSCHMRPTGHSTGQCSKCHTTDTWEIPTSTPIPTEAASAEAIGTPTPVPPQPGNGNPSSETDGTPMPLPTIVPPTKEINPILVPTPPPSLAQ